MAVSQHACRTTPPVRASSRFRLVEDGDAPVLSPALELQRSLLQVTAPTVDPANRYPTAFRLMFPVVVSIGLWSAIVRSI